MISTYGIASIRLLSSCLGHEEYKFRKCNIVDRVRCSRNLATSNSAKAIVVTNVRDSFLVGMTKLHLRVQGYNVLGSGVAGSLLEALGPMVNLTREG